jgi:preprotein translocase subunit SecY
MNRHFAIGCMCGGAWAFVVGGFWSLCWLIITGRVPFLWMTLACVTSVYLCVWMGDSIEKR